jgi:hypothetical protein
VRRLSGGQGLAPPPPRNPDIAQSHLRDHRVEFLIERQAFGGHFLGQQHWRDDLIGWDLRQQFVEVLIRIVQVDQPGDVHRHQRLMIGRTDGVSALRPFEDHAFEDGDHRLRKRVTAGLGHGLHQCLGRGERAFGEQVGHVVVSGAVIFHQPVVDRVLRERVVIDDPRDVADRARIADGDDVVAVERGHDRHLLAHAQLGDLLEERHRTVTGPDRQQRIRTAVQHLLEVRREVGRLQRRVDRLADEGDARRGQHARRRR